MVDKIKFKTSRRVGGRKRLKHAVHSQNLFRHVVLKAESRGMVINTDKAKLLVVSDALTYDPEAYIEDVDGSELTIRDGLKILGFNFSRKPNVAGHIDALRRRFRQCFWILIQLREFGFSEDELAKIYRTIVHPFPILPPGGPPPRWRWLWIPPQWHMPVLSTLRNPFFTRAAPGENHRTQAHSTLFSTPRPASDFRGLPHPLSRHCFHSPLSALGMALWAPWAYSRSQIWPFSTGFLLYKHWGMKIH